MQDKSIQEFISELKHRKPDMSLEEGRIWLDNFIGNAPLYEGVSVENLVLDGVPCEKLTPLDAKKGRALIYFHGGGYIRGSLKGHRPVASYFAGLTGLVTFNVGYQLAPEHRFPVQVFDALAAYEAIVKLGYPASQIALAGESAGGGLICALLLALQQKNRMLPAVCALSSPWTDMTLSGESLITRKKLDPWINPELLPALVGAVLQGEEPNTPWSSPVFANLSGFPPTIIHVGELEVLYDDSFRLYENLRSHGVITEFEEWPGMVHAFHLLAPRLAEGRAAIKKMSDFILKYLR